MSIRFDARVVIITGAAHGLGRAHALAFAERGASVVVNDIPGGDGDAGDIESVAQDIRARGGRALGIAADVTQPDQVQSLVERVLAQWGRIDILINNAGILRDASFGKMSSADFKTVVDVHVIGAANCTKAVWEPMRLKKYGRILYTSSSSGLYANFGQANYGTAKAALVGLMNVLHIEGAKYDVRVNTLVPAATTRMTEGLLPPEAAKLLRPEAVSPAALFLCSETAPSGVILAAGAGVFSRIRIVESAGIALSGEALSPEGIAAGFDALSSRQNEVTFAQAWDQTRRFVAQAEAMTRPEEQS